MSFGKTDAMYNKLIGVEAGRLLGDQRIEERRLKPSRPVITPSWPTSCWPKRLIGRPQEALLCAKAKRQQQQSAQPERKSTTSF